MHRFPLQHAAQSKKVEIALPARVILAGGWTDTPPYCLEREGLIVNFAIKINQKRPILISARHISAPVVRFISRDQGQQVEYDNWGALCESLHHEVDALAIHRSSFYVFCRQAMKRSSMQDFFTSTFGPQQESGVELETNVALPKGSGLGTSSIIIAGCLRALQRLLSPEDAHDIEKEIDNVLAVEQVMESGGGWQDQVGGAIPGLKFSRSWNPGAQSNSVLKYDLEPIVLSPEHIAQFNSRLLAVYTGKERVAQKVLCNVVDNWQLRLPQVVETLAKIGRSANTMHATFLAYAQAGDEATRDAHLQELGLQLDAIRDLNVQLEPNSFLPPQILSLFQFIAPYVWGSHLIGAGNGGFLVGILKPSTNLSQLSLEIQTNFPEASIENFELDVDDISLTIT